MKNLNSLRNAFLKKLEEELPHEYGKNNLFYEGTLDSYLFHLLRNMVSKKYKVYSKIHIYTQRKSDKKNKRKRRKCYILDIGIVKLNAKKLKEKGHLRDDIDVILPIEVKFRNNISYDVLEEDINKLRELKNKSGKVYGDEKSYKILDGCLVFIGENNKINPSLQRKLQLRKNSIKIKGFHGVNGELKEIEI